MNQSFGALIGIATGILSDKRLTDEEIGFLKRWLDSHSALAAEWPGDVVHARLKAVLADGIVTEDERVHLISTLQQLVGGKLEELAEYTHVTSLAFDNLPRITINGSVFCLTGDFVFAPRSVCEKSISERGGIVKSSVSKKINFLVVGGLGSPEWKHGSFGTKIESAVAHKRRGASISIVHEDVWARSL